MNLTISLNQMNIQLGKPQENLELARHAAAEAARRNSGLLLLPELWTSGYDLSNAGDLAQENRSSLPQLASLAVQHNLAIGGSLLLARERRIYNTFTFITPAEPEPVTYEKIHLFRLMDEEKWLAPGERLQQVRLAGRPAGLAICYDLRFPELFRKYAVAGAEILLICAEWPAARINHWQTLLRARAIENQCYVVAVNSVGVTGSETFGGRSAVISPWGEVLTEGPGGEPNLLTATIDLDLVRQVRERIPIFQDRRPEIY
jgi:predicted amidohydrolase